MLHGCHDVAVSPLIFVSSPRQQREYHATILGFPQYLRRRTIFRKFSCRPLITEARVWSRAAWCANYGKQSNPGPGYSPSTQDVFIRDHISHVCLQSFKSLAIDRVVNRNTSAPTPPFPPSSSTTHESHTEKLQIIPHGFLQIPSSTWLSVVLWKQEVT